MKFAKPAVFILCLVPAAWIAYLAYGITSLASALYLWKRTRSRFWDLTAGGANLCLDLPSRLILNVANYHFGAFARKQPRFCRPHTVTCTADNRNLAC
mgnify:CR=1 FL=1